MISNQTKIITVAGLTGIAFALSGCASIVKGTTQSIAITTPMTTGADCALSNAQGNWTLTSPGSAIVARSKTDVRIRCTKTGFQDAQATAPSGFEAWTLGNILIGGLIGLGIDWGTGAIHKYPDAVQVPMTPIPGAPSAAESPREPLIVSTISPTS